MPNTKKRGRPKGGKYPEVVREYWRISKAASRELKKQRSKKQ